MKTIRVCLVSALLAVVAFANANNTWQIDKTVKNNYLARAGGDVAYEYGHPSGGSEESNVAAQWIFDESSGSVVDEVNSISLAPGAATSMDYEQAVTGVWENLSPAMLGNSTVDYMVNASAQPDLDIGTGDAVIEFVMSTTSTDNTDTLFSCKDASNNKGYELKITGKNAALGWQFRATSEDETTLNANMTGSNSWNDGSLHKLRLVLDRTAGTVKIFLDGSEEVSGGVSGLAGKSLKCNGFYLFSGVTSGPFQSAGLDQAEIAEMRFSIGTTTNNSGGPNGG